MRIAFGLDGLLADIDTQKKKYADKLQVQGDPFTNPRILKLEEFWHYMPAQPDLRRIVDLYAEDEIWILTERPKRLANITYSWLQRQGIEVDKQHIIYSTIKRFDCRINDIDVHIDISFDNESWYKYDYIIPIRWERIT